MSTVSIPVIRHILRSPASPLRAQRRWARVQDVKFVARQQSTQQVLDRYKQKLEQKAKQEGHESISSLKEAYKEKITEVKRSATKPPPGDVSSPPKQAFQQPHSPPPPPQPTTTTATPKSTTSSSSGTPGIKPLSSYLDLEKIAALPQKEIEYLWRLRHANNSKSLCAVVPIETYKRIYETARTHPRFILPLPRPAAEDGSGDVKQADNGFEGGARTAADIHFLQWTFHPPAGLPPAPGSRTQNTHTSTILFTHLAAYKLHGEFAQPHTIVTHHLDLADSHGIVLLNGSVTDGRGVSVEEGRWLLMCMQKFYDFEGHGGGIGKEKRQNLLRQFSTGDTTFNLEELVDEAERVS